VKAGECWAVLGHNGSGKSTLLSLINADNPQAFSQKIWLFDKRKGSGESIWDIGT
jgi:molybdate transport system ATP-binding protein